MVIFVYHNSKMKSGFIHIASSHRLYEAMVVILKGNTGKGRADLY